MKLRFCFFCAILFSLISCRVTQFDFSLPETSSYPDFYIFTIQKPLYTFVDTLKDKVYKICKEGNRILISTTNQEHNLNEYWIEKIDSSEHNFQLIPYYKKRGFMRNYKKKEKWKRKRTRSSSSGWKFASPIPDWSRYDTLFLNINRIDAKNVSCQLSYWLDTTEIFFETRGIINNDK